MPAKSFRPTALRLFALLAALLVVFVLAIFLFRNTIVISIINYNGASSEVKAECLAFNLEWDLSVNIAELCIKHPMAEIKLNQAKWNFSQHTLSIDSLAINHLITPAVVNQGISNNEQSMFKNSGVYLDKLPSLDIKELIIASPWLDAPLNIQLKHHKTTGFEILGAIKAEVVIAEGNVTAELEWRIADVTQFSNMANQSFAAYSELMDIEAIKQGIIVSKIDFDGVEVRNTNHINFNSTLTLNNCLLPFNSVGDVSINTKLSDLSVDIDLSKISFIAELDKCQSLREFPELSNFKRLLVNVPQPINLQNNVLTVEEINAIIPGETPSSLKLLNLKFQNLGKSSLDYVLAFNPEIKPNLKFKKILFSSIGDVAFGDDHWQLQSSLNKFDIIDQQAQRYAADNLEATIGLRFSVTDGIKGSGRLQSPLIRAGNTRIGKLASTYTVTGPDINQLHIHGNNHFENISYNTLPVNPKETPKAQVKLAIKQFRSNIDIQLIALKEFTATADTELEQLNILNYPFTQISIKHELQGNISENALISSHNIIIDNKLSAKVEQQQKQFQLHMDKQKLTNMKSLLKGVTPELKITEGTISANLAGEVDSLIIHGDLNLENVSVTIQKYQLNGISYQNTLIFNSAGLQLNPSNISVNLVNVGIPIQNIQAALSASNSTFRLENVKGEIFDGSFTVNELWLDSREQSAEIELFNIELAKLVELQKQPGISVTGQVKGSLPIQFNKNGVTVNDGAIISQGPGKLRILNNPAFESIKAQQAELAFLENMDFTQLSSKVKLNPDGMLFLNLSLLGENTQKKQGLKFNYSHQENIFTLLESLRLTSSVQNKIEKALKEGGKK